MFKGGGSCVGSDSGFCWFLVGVRNDLYGVSYGCGLWNFSENR